MQLGPARFTHIATCAREVCRAFKLKDELQECVTTLQTLDSILEALRAELSQLVDATPTLEAEANEAKLIKTKSFKSSDYSELFTSKDIKKARRLVTAREKAIAIVKASLAKKSKDKGTL